VWNEFGFIGIAPGRRAVRSVPHFTPSEPTIPTLKPFDYMGLSIRCIAISVKTRGPSLKLMFEVADAC
jgi:hypothetical protein